MEDLRNKVAVVTGAGTGIGRAVAEACVAEGMYVAMVGRRVAKLEEVAQHVARAQVLCCPCDVADRAAVDAMADRVLGHFGPAHLLVNNAGINTVRRSVADVDPTDWDRTLAINLTGAYNCIRSFLPAMRKLRDGLIVNIASTAGKRPSKFAGAAYSASKHGVIALTHCINEEEVDHGIRATAICPGEVETPILDFRPEPVSPEHRARILKPADVAAAVLFVARLPCRVSVPELIIKPAFQIYR